MSDKKIVAVSGGFDPIHIGHVRYIRESATLGDELVVIVNNDNWLRAKKGKVFMTEQERVEIIEGIKGVTRVVLTNHAPGCTDMSVCDVLREVRPTVYAKGGDRFAANIPETALCQELGIQLAEDIGRGGKVQSSSWLSADDRETRSCFCGSEKRYIDCHGIGLRQEG